MIYDQMALNQNETVVFRASKEEDIHTAVFYCLWKRGEIVVECSPELQLELEKIQSEYSIIRLKEVKKYLKDNNIDWVEESFKGTLQI